jgi:hypothetical protein
MGALAVDARNRYTRGRIAHAPGDGYDGYNDI